MKARQEPADDEAELRRKIRLLAVDDQPEFLDLLQRLLSHTYLLETATTPEEAIRAVRGGGIDVVLLDLMFGDELIGFEVLRDLLAIDSDLPVVILTRETSCRLAMKAIQQGAAAYVDKIAEPEELREMIREALDALQLRLRYRFFRERVEAETAEMVGASPAMQTLRRELTHAALLKRAPVLLVGETGSGKEVVASLLHRHSDLPGPLISVNCAALPKELVESEIFGCVEGAFTGARTRRGLFELAADGTVFLDEITKVEASFQSKLLRVIEENRFVPVGAELNRYRAFGGRILASTNRRLEEALASGELLEDLLHRFVKVIEVPPLRARMEDIPLLVSHFIDQAAREFGVPAKPLPAEDMALLQSYSWPGNVRELLQVIRNFMVPMGDASGDGRIVIPGLVRQRGAMADRWAQAVRADGADRPLGLNLPIHDLLGLKYHQAVKLLIWRFQRAYIPPIIAQADDLTSAAGQMGLTLPGLRGIRQRLEKPPDSRPEES